MSNVATKQCMIQIHKNGGRKLKDITKEKKNYLRRYTNYLTRVKKLEDKLETIEGQLVGVKSVSITDMPRGGKPLSKEDLFEQKEEILGRIKTILDILHKVKTETFECIDQVDDYQLAIVLEQYFIDGLTLEQIAEKNHYSTRHAGFLYAKGIEKVELVEP